MAGTTNAAVRAVAGRGIPVRGNDIDTDRIIPARYMKVVTFEGLGRYAFHDARFNEDGTKKDHPFNDERFRGASVLLVNRNFGCGSSREHAPQALAKAGIAAVLGESFAEIFAGNCTAMGLPAVQLSREDVETLMSLVEDAPATELALDLETLTVSAGGRRFPCSLPPSYRSSLLEGSWDSTAVLMDNLEAVERTAASLPYLKGFRQEV